MVLQFANATVGYYEESKAGDAIAALKAKLAPQCHVCRDGRWISMAAKELVPGDLIELKIGDIVPADAIMLDGKPVEVDQAALTGESLPVSKNPWEQMLMGSALKRGEVKAVVANTGPRTFFGKAAGMIAGVVAHGRLQTVLFNITMALLVLSVILCAIIFGKLMLTPEDPRALKEGEENIPNKKLVDALSIVIVILVASIPIAIEVVCTSTLALGSHELSSKGIIVARLSAIEELAGMTVLCSDKTGTLTKNKLELLEPIVLSKDFTPEDIVLFAALCSKRAKGNQDAIDFAVTDDVSNGYRLAKATAKYGYPLEAWEELQFEPFNPTDKRTTSIVRQPDGSTIQCAKGAPQVILKMAYNKEELAGRVAECVQELGDRGYRALGVAINRSNEGEPDMWEYLGILSIYDPPRDDTKATIAAAIENGIEVKMVTGDHKVIAKETCRLLGMGTNILSTEVIDANANNVAALDRIILESHGFAEVMPEHKFQIVERIRQQKHVTGMTGDGVNDAPALKRADVGIAVAGATDAARAASDLVLTSEGLSVIIDAIFESRKIFQRMRNYIIYRIACTIQLLLFFFFTVLCVEPDGKLFYNKIYPEDEREQQNKFNPLAHANEFSLPVISLVIITILNDGCMITISHDQVLPEKKPQRWAMAEMTVVAIVLGLVACLSSLGLLVLCMNANVLHPGYAFGILYGSSKDYVLWYELRTIIYLKVSISDFLTLFSARTRTWFWNRSIGSLLGGAAVFALSMSTLFSLIWDLMFGDVGGAYMRGLRFSGGAVTNVWIYCVIWWLIQDAAKVYTYHLIEKGVLGDLDDKPPELPNKPQPAGGMLKQKVDAMTGEKMAPVVVNPLQEVRQQAAAAASSAESADWKSLESARNDRSMRVKAASAPPPGYSTPSRGH
jgi:H+-transporting ATPase